MKTITSDKSKIYFIILFTLCIILPNIIPLTLYYLGYMSIDRTLIFLAYCACLLIIFFFSSRRLVKWLFFGGYICLTFLDYALIVKESFFLDFIDVFLHSKDVLNFDYRENIVYYYSIIAIISYIILSFILIGWTGRYAAQNRNKVTFFVSLGISLLIFIPFYLVQYTEPKGVILEGKLINVERGAVIDSATAESKLIDYSTNNKNYIVIITEALGLPKDNDLHDLLFSMFYSKDIESKYIVTEGKVPYKGNTYWGEIRELCDVYYHYLDIMEGKTVDCIPEKLKKQGYETIAFRSYLQDFFSFNKWYKLIGFDKIYLGDELLQGMRYPAKICKNLFTGLCDADAIHVIKEKLDQATQPTFFYWVTVNSHQPVTLQKIVPERFYCDDADKRIGTDEVCRTVEIWYELFTHVVKVALELENTEILLVGDHAPPFLKRQSRSYFSNEYVPWIRLSPRTNTAPDTP